MTESSDDRALRWALLGLGLSAGLALVYASILPLEYRPLPLTDAIDRFADLRWLQLGVYRRADWVANGLAAVPLGFLLAGAADRDRRFTLGYALKLAAILVLVNALVVGIEFLQLWFPRRTISGNDIAAGCIGVTAGVLAWPWIGRPMVAVWGRLRQRSNDASFVHRSLLAALGLFAFLLSAYSVMPLDLMAGGDEWRAKWNEGRFAAVPTIDSFALDAQSHVLDYAMIFTLAAVRMVPWGFLLTVAPIGRSRPWLLIGFPLLIEIVQAPIFTRYSTLSDVICGWIGGAIGMALAQHRHALLRCNDHLAVRIGMLAAAAVLVVTAFLARFQRWSTDTEIAQAWDTFWTAPFAKYYYTSEFLGGSNVLGKWIAFAILGFLLANVAARPGQRRRTPGWGAMLVSAAVVLTIATGVELAQIHVQPFIADASDIVLAGIGGGIGWWTYRVIVTWIPVSSPQIP